MIVSLTETSGITGRSASNESSVRRLERFWNIGHRQSVFGSRLTVLTMQSSRHWRHRRNRWFVCYRTIFFTVWTVPSATRGLRSTERRCAAVAIRARRRGCSRMDRVVHEVVATRRWRYIRVVLRLCIIRRETRRLPTWTR